MFKNSFLFELRYRLKSPGTWICLVALILMAYREMLAGEWDLLIQSGRVARNSPYTVYYLFMYYTFWAATVGSALMIPTLLRDLKSGTAELLYSFPIHSKQYFLGKYLASMLVFVLVMSSVAIGFITMPYITAALGTHDASEFVTTPWAHIGHAFVLWVLPACFVYGSLTFALTAISGRTGPAYALMMLAVGLFVMITALYGDGAPKSTLVQILDPLGKVTVEGQIYYWTAEERMQRFLAFEGALLQNRLLYITLAATVLIVALINFDVRQLLQRAKGRDAKIAAKKIAAAQKSANEVQSWMPDNVTANSIELNRTSTWLYWFSHAVVSGWQLFGVVIKNKAFYLSMLTLIAMLVLAGFSYQPVAFEGSGKLLPKVFILMPGLMYPSLIFTLVAAAFFSIELCDREKSFRIDQLVEACPVPTWSLMLAKLIGVMLMALTLTLIPVVAVLCIQFGQGYFDTSWTTLAHVTGLVLLPLMLSYVLISLICYAVLQHKALAQGVAIVVCITPAIFNEVKTVENFMYLWAWPFFVQLSDFAASAQYVQRNASFAVYWLSLYFALTVVAYWLWPRGAAAPTVVRLGQAISRMRPVSIVLAGLFGSVFVWSALQIHAGMVVRNHYQSSNEEHAEQADYEKRYSATRDTVQPKIIDADINVDLYPAQRRADYSANLTLANKSAGAIDELIMHYADFSTIKALAYNRQPLTAQQHDHIHRRLSYRLPQPLLPGQTAVVNIELEASYQGFSNDEFDYHGTLVADGSYFGSSMWPTFGYDRLRELEAVGLRQQYALGKRKLKAPLSAAGVVADIATTDDADLLTSRIHITTHSDQIPIAPGESNCHRQQEERTSCVYESQQLMPWNIHMVSGRYQLAKASWYPEQGGQPVTIELYFHPDHGDNIEHFITAAKHALSEGHRQWGQFPYQSLRLAEVPNGLTDSQVSGNLIIIPETHGWLHDYRQTPATDWITYQVARDVSRIWWQQVAVADVRGQQLLTDAIAALQGLRAIASAWSPAASARFVDQISDNYLRERTTEDQLEVAVIDLDRQQYAVNKASLALFSAYHELGATAFTTRLSTYFNAKRNNTRPPYAHSGDLIQLLLSGAPDPSSEQRLKQLFYATHYYDFRVASTRVTGDSNNGYQLHVDFTGTQYQYNAGKDHMSDYQGPIDVQVLGGEQRDIVLYDGKLHFQRGNAQLQLMLPQKPLEVVINAQRRLLERSPNNNAQTL